MARIRLFAMIRVTKIREISAIRLIRDSDPILFYIYRKRS